MNKDRTGAVSTANALKMAIEHIENGGATTERKVVLNACKEALDTKQVCENAAPAQEPRSIMESFDKMLTEKLVYYKEKRPAQPLSDDEIEKVWYSLYPLNDNNLWGDMLEGKHLKNFARAIEQAHGIV